jgi:hypothetical protein
VSLSRAAACGSYGPSPIVVRVSRVRIDENGQPAAGALLARRRVVLHSTPCETKTIRLHVRPPFRIDLSTARTFEAPDGRQLSAQVGFGYRAGR